MGEIIHINSTVFSLWQSLAKARHDPQLLKVSFILKLSMPKACPWHRFVDPLTSLKSE